ncbi:hypothetical protein MHYP_G00021380 [Metynnis hypsauchen]
MSSQVLGHHRIGQTVLLSCAVMRWWHGVLLSLAHLSPTPIRSQVKNPSIWKEAGIMARASSQPMASAASIDAEECLNSQLYINSFYAGCSVHLSSNKLKNRAR